MEKLYLGFVLLFFGCATIEHNPIIFEQKKVIRFIDSHIEMSINRYFSSAYKGYNRMARKVYYEDHMRIEFDYLFDDKFG